MSVKGVTLNNNEIGMSRDTQLKSKRKIGSFWFCLNQKIRTVPLKKNIPL